MRRTLMIVLCFTLLLVTGNSVVIEEINKDLKDVLKNIDEQDGDQINKSMARTILPELGYAITSVYVAVANILGRFTTPKPARSRNIYKETLE